jgi:hypothetical protein
MSTTVEVSRVRASSIPLAVLCAASLSDGLKVDFSDETGTTGNEVHRALAMRLRGEPSPELDVEGEAMVALGLEWVKQTFKGQGTTELAVSDEFGSGTIDLSYKVGALADVADFKTGFRDDNHWPQIYRYAHLYFQKHPDVQIINLHIVWLRKEGVDFKQVTRAWIFAWWEEFVRNTLNHPDVFSPGDHCSRCRRRVDCPALGAMNRQTALAFSDGPASLSLTREKIAELRPKVKLIEQVIKAFDAAVRAEVLEGGPIPLGDGKELRAVTINKDTIQIQQSLEILQAHFTDSEINEFVTIGKTKMLEAIGAKVAKGKGKAQDALMAKLEAAGAVQKHSSIQIREAAIRA